MPRRRARHCRISPSSMCRPIALQSSASPIVTINECVAVGDRILMLFETNTEEVFVVDRIRPADTQPSRTILIT